MNKSDLITALAAKEKLTEKLATEIINLIFNGFANTLEKGGRIEVRGFGTIVVREYEAYTGRNPRTGNYVNVQPKKLPFFKVGKQLEEMVNADD